MNQINNKSNLNQYTLHLHKLLADNCVQSWWDYFINPTLRLKTFTSGFLYIVKSLTDGLDRHLQFVNKF